MKQDLMDVLKGIALGILVWILVALLVIGGWL